MNFFLKNMGALNDATRLQILIFIMQHNEVCVCDIEKSFNMIQSRISRHLKILKDAGFLEVQRRGRWAYYKVASELQNFQKMILQELASLDIELPKLQKGCSL